MGVFWRGIVYLLKDFSCWTSTHGISHIGMANAQWLKIFWALVVIGSLGGFICQFLVLVSKYFSFTVNTETMLQFSERVFPTVTICNLNPWKRDEVMVADKEMRNMIITYESMGVDSDSFGFSMNGNRQQRATKFAALMSERMYKKSQNAEFKHAYTYNDLIISCTYNAKPCNITDFTEFYDPSYGICHMFNYNGQYFSSRAGPLYGLRIVARIDQAKYLPWTEVAGVIISIHEQGEIPFPDISGYFAPPGTASSMGVRFVSTTRLPQPYGSCTTQQKEFTKQYNGTYEVEACFRSCLQEKIIAECGCYDPAYSHGADGTPGCDTHGNPVDNLECIGRISNSDTGMFNVIHDCNCPQPCDVQSYTVTVSTAHWPSRAFQPAECSGDPVEKPWEITGISCLDWYKKNTLLMEIYYERMNYQVLKESPAYSIVNLISDVGGQLGLFLGVSIISLIEFLALFLLLIYYCCTHKRRRTEIEQLENEKAEAKREADRIAELNQKATMKNLNKEKMYAGTDDLLPPPVMDS